MNICLTCLEIFKNPKIIYDDENDEQVDVCPFCGDDNLDEVPDNVSPPEFNKKNVAKSDKAS